MFLPQILPWERVYFLDDPDAQEGVFNIGWNHPVVTQIGDFEKLPGYQIAIETNEKIKGAVTVVNRETRESFNCLIRQAIEVAGIDDDDMRYEVLTDARIVAFEANTMRVEARLNDPVKIIDYISVTFWKTSLIKRQDAGIDQIALGTEILVPASLQVSSDSEMETKAIFETFIALVTMIVLVNIAIVILGGSFTPLWILLYSFQLIVYAVLLELPQAPTTSCAFCSTPYDFTWRPTCSISMLIRSPTTVN